MRKVLFISLLISFVVGCTEGVKNTEFINIEELSKTITDGRIIYEADSIGALIDLRIKGDYIIFRDDHPSAKIKFYVINKNTGEFISNYGYVGRGPNEYMQPVIIQNDDTYNPDTSIDIYELQTNILYRVSLNDMTNINAIRENTKQMSGLIDATGYINLIDNKVLYKGLRPGELDLFKIQDINSGEKLCQADFFPTSLNIKDPGYVYDSKLCASPKSDKIIAGMSFFDFVNIYDYNGNLVKQLQFGDKPLPVLDENGDIKDFNMYTMHALPAKKYCYLTRFGHNISSKSDKKEYGVFLIVLDWDGNFIKSFYFKEAMFKFCVDEATNKFYGVANDNEGNGTTKILEYNIELD